MNPTLAARVKAVNRANAYALDLYDRLCAVFRPLVGQNILKVDGSLLKRVEALMPPLPHDNGLMVYRYSSNHSLMWVVKTCENIPEKQSCVYHETSVYVGKLSGAELHDLYEPLTARTDYDAEEVAMLREQYAIAKRDASDALSALHPFGEYDR